MVDVCRVRIMMMSVTMLIFLAAAVAGCASDPTKGYAAHTMYREDVDSVAVPIFENATFHRDLEFELTDALIKQIEATTPYRVTSSGQADTILTGRIHRVELDEISRSRLTGLTEEAVVSVTIDFHWTDLRTDEPLVQRQSFTGHGLFTPSRPNSEPIAIGRFAVVQQLARDIVSQMQAPW